MNENETQDRHTLPLFDPDITIYSGDRSGTSEDVPGAEVAFDPNLVKLDAAGQEKNLFSDI